MCLSGSAGGRVANARKARSRTRPGQPLVAAVCIAADLYFFLFKTGVAKIFWVTVCTDYAFAITFFIFLGLVAKQKALLAAKSTS